MNLICRLFVLYADGETSWSSWTDFGWEICDDPPPLPVRGRAVAEKGTKESVAPVRGRAIAKKGTKESVSRSRRQNGQR